MEGLHTLTSVAFSGTQLEIGQLLFIELLRLLLQEEWSVCVFRLLLIRSLKLSTNYSEPRNWMGDPTVNGSKGSIAMASQQKYVCTNLIKRLLYHFPSKDTWRMKGIECTLFRGSNSETVSESHPKKLIKIKLFKEFFYVNKVVYKLRASANYLNHLDCFLS